MFTVAIDYKYWIGNITKLETSKVDVVYRTLCIRGNLNFCNHIASPEVRIASRSNKLLLYKDLECYTKDETSYEPCNIWFSRNKI